MSALRNLRKRFRRTAERGAALVETGIVLPFLLLLAVGLAEVGLSFIDWMAVSNAAREGARVGASAGTFDEGGSNADDLILSVIGQASCAIDNGRLISVRIFKADENGNLIGSAENRYRPNLINCATNTSTWTRDAFDWPPATRNNKFGNLDRLAVEITFDHDSITGLLPAFDTIWTDQAAMRLEPNTRG